MSQLNMAIDADFQSEYLDRYTSRAPEPMGRRAEDTRSIAEGPSVRWVVKGHS